LETIGLRHQNHRQGDGDEETNGNFPIYIFGDNDYQLAELSGRLLVLSDSYLYIYTTDGSLSAARQHTYGNAMMQTAGEYVMLYESGGTHFRLENAVKTRFEKTLPDPIIFGRVSPSGLTAIVTGSDACACKLYVYNLKGQQIYERSCVERLTEITFMPDDSGCCAASISAANGGLKSVLHGYSFTEKTDLWTSEPLDTLAISVYNTNEGNLFVLGDTMCCFMTANGLLLSSYQYPDELAEGSFAGNTAAVLLNDAERRTESLVIMDGSADRPMIWPFEKNIKDIAVLPESGSVLVQFRNVFKTVQADGLTAAVTPVSDNYDGFLRIGQYLFLRGYNYIDVQEYEAS
ncbi:MAG: hypothetical protein IKQ91_08695, partial [Oscillospiraceae bacterium]|nr:hypothetical protein [Oscillospiraceae bacterium]